MSEPRSSSKRVVVGILHPPEWYGDTDQFEEQLQRMRDLDPRVEVTTIAYIEPGGRRAGTTPNGAERPPAPVLTAEQADNFARIEVALALDLPDDLATVAPRLRWVQAIGAGVDHLEPKIAPTAIRLTTNGGSNATGIAEFVMTRILEHHKPLDEIAALQRDHRWQPRYGRQLAGATLALIGFGPINQAVAARAIAFGMRVLVVRRTPGEAPDGVADVVSNARLHEVLAQSDVVVSAVPESPSTTGMFDADAFAAMPAGSFFCNVGRGSLVDEPALIAALQSGHLAGAAIDVARAEPLPPDDPLWDAPRLRISAHCSSVPSAMFPEVHRLFLANLRRYLDGEPLHSEVDVARV